MIHKRHSLNPGKVVVVFEIPSTIWADRVNLVGDFNNQPFKVTYATSSVC
jgi:hypothetical protein